MKLSILLSVVSLSTVMCGPTNQLKPATAAKGPLSEALLDSSSTLKPSASKESHGNVLADDPNSRRAKMINYFGYYPGYFGNPAAPPNPHAAFMAPYTPQLSDFYQFPYGTIAPVYSYNGLLGDGTGGGGISSDDSYGSDETQSTANDVDSNESDYDENIFSRANRRRPSKGGPLRNSPIFYIRLPPTPYMFMPTPVPQYNFNPSPYQNPYMQNPYMQQPPPPPPNPFINVPVNYMSNAKPVGVYQYQTGYQQPQAGPAMRFPSLNGYGPNPVRQRPSYSAASAAAAATGNGYNNPDSKITHLKGPFIFNGRPEDIYLLQNLQTTPYNANFFHGYY